MKSLKNVLAALAFVLAIGATLAFNMKDVVGVPASYPSGQFCLNASTITDECDRNNPGTQCQINIPGTPDAFLLGDCTVALRKPQGQ